MTNIDKELNLDATVEMDEKGFTLIELIVVMAIIGVLVLLAAPRFLGYTKDAKVRAMQQDTKVLSDAAHLYHIDEEGWPKVDKLEVDLPDELTGVEVYSLSEQALDSYVKSIRGEYNEYGLITSKGAYEGQVIHLNGLYDKDNNVHYGSDVEVKDGTVGENELPVIPEDTTPEVESGEHTNFGMSKDKFESLPGGNVILAGNAQAGFFGEVDVSELYTGAEIASAVDITQGTLQHNDEPWLKFAIDGKVIYKAKKPYRHSISWDHINSKDAVFGKEVEKGGNKYKVRLMRGLDPKIPVNGPNSEYNGTANHGSEWNRLMLPIHENATEGKKWAHENNVEGNVPNWGIGYTDKDLHTHHTHGDGTRQWMQEKYDSPSRVVRGFVGVSSSSADGSSGASAGRGWAPVLEVLPNSAE